jgi:uncharacterized protein (DUF1697 family)
VTTFIALLRGVNLAGRKMVAMADLRELLERLKFSEPRSLLQSGNLLFRTGARSGAALERLLETEAAQRLDLTTDFHVRSAAEWKATLARNPFPDEAKRDPGRLLVMLFKEELDAVRVKALQAAIPGRERFAAKGREAFLVYPDGVGQSRLTTALLDRTLGARGTARNWNTVQKLAAAAAT